MAQRQVKQKRLKKYSIGDLNKRILIHVRSIEAPDFDSANFEEDYDSGLPCWARISVLDPMGKTFFDGVDLKEGKPTHIFVIRYRENITSENVIRWQSNLYKIVGIPDPEERHEYLELYSKILGDQNLKANQ
jgi:SPP1 family predicted phage head-tail adaptor